MKDFSQYKEVGKTTNTITYSLEAEPDILIVVPLEGTMDNARDAQENVAFFYSYAHQLGKSIGCAVIMSNMLSQEAEARRAYAEIDPKQVFGGALVVESALSRALGSFFVGLSRPLVPTKLFSSIEGAIEWLKSMRPK